MSESTNMRQNHPEQEKGRRVNTLNEELKRREAAERERMLTEVEDGEAKVLALDDTQRVKVLSPGRLVAKRFFRNKLAMVGLGILIAMFTFAFLLPIVYPYSQTEIFHTHKQLRIDYANAKLRTEYVAYQVDDEAEIHYSVKNKMNSSIATMQQEGKADLIITDPSGVQYVLRQAGDKVYTLSTDELIPVAEYSASSIIAEYARLGGKFTWKAGEQDEEFQAAVVDAVTGKKAQFTVGGMTYTCAEVTKHNFRITRITPVLIWDEEDEAMAGFGSLITTLPNHVDGSSFQWNGGAYRLKDNGGGSFDVCAVGGSVPVMVFSTFAFDAFEAGSSFSDEFKAAALLALYETDTFQVDGEEYTLRPEDDTVVFATADGVDVAELSDYAVRRYSGQDTLTVEFKETVRDIIFEMEANTEASRTFTYMLPQMDETANYITDEAGNLQYVETELRIDRKVDGYVMTCVQTTFLIDIFSRPSDEHMFGTDGDGMDILARMMYGGRISLLVGFVVVVIELIIGTILGGIAGFFGGWVDTLIMRLVDVFYCIPSMPILIIMGAFFDAVKMDPYQRLMWLMAILGILGWASIARLVRGQILSLREQEFMVAEEATGMKASRRIFRHLVPNVMPQLIVSATMGLGSVIITESTLSYLGLGVKHPLATWGNMINSVTSSSEMMINYAYIWVPVGFLISLTVIAFNFVGDGLRDAFDPKMKQ